MKATRMLLMGLLIFLMGSWLVAIEIVTLSETAKGENAARKKVLKAANKYLKKGFEIRGLKVEKTQISGKKFFLATITLVKNRRVGRESSIITQTSRGTSEITEVRQVFRSIFEITTDENGDAIGEHTFFVPKLLKGATLTNFEMNSGAKSVILSWQQSDLNLSLENFLEEKMSKDLSVRVGLPLVLGADNTVIPKITGAIANRKILVTYYWETPVSSETTFYQREVKLTGGITNVRFFVPDYLRYGILMGFTVSGKVDFVKIFYNRDSRAQAVFIGDIKKGQSFHYTSTPIDQGNGNELVIEAIGKELPEAKLTFHWKPVPVEDETEQE